MSSGSNIIPHRLINAKVFNSSGEAIGVATVTLPEIQAMTETVSGIGIAGELDEPIPGHYQPMSLELKWLTITKQAIELKKHKAHALDIRASQQVYDASMGEYLTVPVRASVKATPTSLSLGDIEPGKPTNTTQTFSVSFLKLFVDGEEVLHIDKYNFVDQTAGEDSMAGVRKDLGLA